MLQGWRLGVPLVAVVYGAYAAVPGRVWTAWPLFLILAAPGLLSVAVAIVFRSVERRSDLDSSYRDRPAGGWLMDRLGQAPALGISLVGISDDDQRNCYHSDSRTIALADVVHHGNTLGNYAVAAHELGHALMHARAPRLFRFTLWCRGKGERCFFWGWLVLVAMAVGTLLVLAAAWLTTRFHLSPLERLTAHIRTMQGRSGRDRLAPAEGGGEVAALAEAFNQMMGEADRRADALAASEAKAAEALRYLDRTMAAVDELVMLWNDREELVFVNAHFYKLYDRVADRIRMGITFPDYAALIWDAGYVLNYPHGRERFIEERTHQFRGPGARSRARSPLASGCG